MNDNGKVVTIVTSLLAAFTGLYPTYAGGRAPVEHFTRAAAKEIWRPRLLGQQRRNRTNGYTVLLSGGDAGRQQTLYAESAPEDRASAERCMPLSQKY